MEGDGLEKMEVIKEGEGLSETFVTGVDGLVAVVLSLEELEEEDPFGEEEELEELFEVMFADADEVCNSVPSQKIVLLNRKVVC